MIIESTCPPNTASRFYKKILFFGITYKENVDDIRNSPALNIIKRLSKNMPSARTFDLLNDTYNNISIKEIRNIKFEILVIFVKHDWQYLD